MEIPVSQQQNGELGIQDVAKIIFTNPPQDMCTVSIGIENIQELLPVNSTQKQKDDLEKQILTDIVFIGIEVLFSLDFNKMTNEERLLTFSNITYDEFSVMKKYMESLGYRPIVHRYYKDSLNDPEQYKKITGIHMEFENLWNSLEHTNNSTQLSGSVPPSN